jgi:exosome complex component RRP43
LLVWNVQLPDYLDADQKQDRSAAIVERLETYLPTHLTHREGGFFRLEELVIQRREAIWILYVDIVCLSDDGELLDPILVLVNALFRGLTLPVVQYDPEQGSVTQLSQDGGQPVSYASAFSVSVQCLLVKENHAIPGPRAHEEIPALRDVFLVDPSQEERQHLGGSEVTLLYGEDGRLLAMDKQSGAAIPMRKLTHLISHCRKQLGPLRALLAA